MKQKILPTLTIFSNICLILFGLYIVSESYGSDRFMVLFILIPPVLSLWMLRSAPDGEERKLMRRLRKAQIRKELKALSEFDS